MRGWLRAVLLAAMLMVGTWALLVLLARRLPPGLLRDLAGIVPDGVTTSGGCAAIRGCRVGPKSWMAYGSAARPPGQPRTWWSHRRWWR
jgi:hypothetical protein